jgi:hypothetical protein
MGPHPVTGRARRWRRKLLLCSAALPVGTALFLVLTLVPTKRYVPRCGARDVHLLHGPMREQHVALLAQAMAEEGFRHYRDGSTILVPVWPVFDGRRHRSWANFQLSFPWRMASNVAGGCPDRPSLLPSACAGSPPALSGRPLRVLPLAEGGRFGAIRAGLQVRRGLQPVPRGGPEGRGHAERGAPGPQRDRPGAPRPDRRKAGASAMNGGEVARTDPRHGRPRGPARPRRA